MEIRSFSEERAMPTVLENTRTIEGYSTLFEKESRVMFDPQKKRFFVEIIKRGAVTENDFKDWDIKALAEHDKSRLLARSFNGSGTLQLSVDDFGVKYRFDAPKTVEGDNAIEMISRRDIFGSSFAYISDEKLDVRYYIREDGMLIREVNKIRRMFDVSVVTDPAYFGTDVCVRSLDVYFNDNKDDEVWKKQVEETRSLIK